MFWLEVNLNNLKASEYGALGWIRVPFRKQESKGVYGDPVMNLSVKKRFHTETFIDEGKPFNWTGSKA